MASGASTAQQIAAAQAAQAAAEAAQAAAEEAAQAARTAQQAAEERAGQLQAAAATAGQEAATARQEAAAAREEAAAAIAAANAAADEARRQAAAARQEADAANAAADEANAAADQAYEDKEAAENRALAANAAAEAARGQAAAANEAAAAARKEAADANAAAAAARKEAAEANEDETAAYKEAAAANAGKKAAETRAVAAEERANQAIAAAQAVAAQAAAQSAAQAAEARATQGTLQDKINKLVGIIEHFNTRMSPYFSQRGGSKEDDFIQNGEQIKSNFNQLLDSLVKANADCNQQLGNLQGLTNSLIEEIHKFYNLLEPTYTKNIFDRSSINDQIDLLKEYLQSLYEISTEWKKEFKQRPVVTDKLIIYFNYSQKSKFIRSYNLSLPIETPSNRNTNQQFINTIKQLDHYAKEKQVPEFNRQSDILQNILINYDTPLTYSVIKDALIRLQENRAYDIKFGLEDKDGYQKILGDTALIYPEMARDYGGDKRIHIDNPKYNTKIQENISLYTRRVETLISHLNRVFYSNRPSRGGGQYKYNPSNPYKLMKDQEAWEGLDDETRELLDAPERPPIFDALDPLNDYIDENADPTELEDAREEIGLLSVSEVEDALQNDTSEFLDRLVEKYKTILPGVDEDWLPSMVRADILRTL